MLDNENSYYEELIPKLYKQSMKKVIADAIIQELPFEVEQAEEPEPAIIQTEHEVNLDENAPKETTILDKWKSRLANLVKEVTE